MRFRASRENLTLWPNQAKRDECVIRVVRLLVPRHTKGVYVVWHVPEAPPAPVDGMALVHEGEEPSNLLGSFRVLVYAGEVIVVSGESSRFTRSQWRALASALAASS